MSQQTLSIEQVRELAKTPLRGKRQVSRMAALKAIADARRASYRVSTEPVSFRLPLPPPLNHYYGQAVIQGHVVKYLSKEAREYQGQVYAIWREIGITFEGRLAMKVVAVFRDHREPDLDAFWKGLKDSLAMAGAYENDRQIKAESIEQDRVQAPGWLDIVLGPKATCQAQKNLFSVNW